jgi:hypothetical protein
VRRRSGDVRVREETGGRFAIGVENKEDGTGSRDLLHRMGLKLRFLLFYSGVVVELVGTMWAPTPLE